MTRIWAVSLIVGLASLTAWAQNAPGPNDGAPDPGSASHAVARLSLMNGGVSVSHGNSGEMVGASVNAPLVTTDRVLTGANSRAEVQFDAANSVRLAPSTEVRMGDLQYKRYQVQIAQGLVTFRVLRDNDGQVEISTPSVSVHPVRQGSYRISVSPDGLTQVTVRAGEAEITSPTGSEPLRAGQMMTSRGPASDPEFRTSAAPPLDNWDRWNADRDRIFENYSTVSRNVPPDVYGAEDLGQYGHWTYDPAYGNVWVPDQDPDWAPYRDGRWSYIDYYGWSWVSYDPWGWAPYHYGRWYRGGFGWAWYPGAFGPTYYWSPALVGFFGWGAPGFGASLGFGNVGWCPLAPFEAFHPWWGPGFGGFRNNIVNNTVVNNTTIVNNMNITNVYRNARFNGAVTSMRAGDFGRSAVGRSNFVRASSSDLAHAGIMRGGMPVSPNRESRSFSASPTAGGNVQGMPRTNENTRFFSAPSRSAGASPQTANRSAAGSSFTGGPVAGRSFTGGPSSPSTGGSPAGGSPAGPAGGWRRFDPSTASSGGFQRVQGSVPGSQGQAQGFQGARALQSGGNSPSGNFPGGGFQSGGQVHNATTFESNAPRAFQGSPANGLGGGSQPVRISPPIVNNRSESYGAQRGSASSGGFGGPRPSYGGGGFRGAPSGGGGNRGGGGGGGHSGGGGGGHGGRR
ncbi:MAG TPA: FecR family protein [Bryobacteraceae bacterium]|nr:FecR family protein [Bryobacteraceae bacterium]